MTQSKSNKALNYIYSIKGNVLDDFLIKVIKEMIPSTNYKSNINIIYELNKYMTRRNILPKEQQIIFCIFLALLTQKLEYNTFKHEVIEDKMKIKGNFNKKNIITNICDEKPMLKYKDYIQVTDNTFKNILMGETPVLIETSKLNKRKFDTNTLFLLVIRDYKYELIMPKLVNISLGFLFLLFQFYINTKFPDINPEIKEYIKVVLVDIFETEEKQLKEITYVP